MKKTLYTLLLCLCALALAGTAYAASPLAGRILLQVQNKGILWYASPHDGMRYRLPARSDMAFQALSKQATVIDHRILNRIPMANSKAKGDMNARKLYSGHVLLADNDTSRVWYVNPKDMKRYWFDGTEASYAFFKKLATGVMDKDLDMLPVGQESFQTPTLETTTTAMTTTTIQTEPSTASSNASTTASLETGTSTLPTVALAITNVQVTTSTVSTYDDTVEPRPSVKVTFNTEPKNVTWSGFDTTPSSTQIWTESYPFSYEDGQTIFTLNASNVQAGAFYNYVIQAEDRSTGATVKYNGMFQL